MVDDQKMLIPIQETSQIFGIKNFLHPFRGLKKDDSYQKK